MIYFKDIREINFILMILTTTSITCKDSYGIIYYTLCSRYGISVLKKYDNLRY